MINYESTNEDNVIRKYGVLRLAMFFTALITGKIDRTPLFPSIVFEKVIRDIINSNELKTLYNYSKAVGEAYILENGSHVIDIAKVLTDHKGDVSLFRFITAMDMSIQDQKRSLCEYYMGLPVVYNPMCKHLDEIIYGKLGIPYDSIIPRYEYEEQIFQIWMKTL